MLTMNHVMYTWLNPYQVITAREIDQRQFQPTFGQMSINLKHAKSQIFMPSSALLKETI